MKQELEQRIEETIKSLDGLQRAEANPFLAAKIRHRLNTGERSAGVVVQWSWRLALVMIVFVVLNFITVRTVAKDNQENSGANAVATDYSISLPQAY